MQNNTPFSRDPTPDLTRTILSVVKEGLLGKLKKKAQRFTQGLTTGGDGPPSPGERLMNARWARGHRTEGDIQRAHMKHKARATVKEEQEYTPLNESILSVTNRSVVKEGLLGKLKKKAQRFGQAVSAFNSDGDPSPEGLLQRKREGGTLRAAARSARRDEMKPRFGLKPGQTRRDDGRLRNSKGVLESKSGLVEEQKYIEEYIELLESALESIAEEMECSVEDLLEDLPPKSYVDRIKKKTAQLSPEQRAAAMKDRNSGIHRTPAELKKFAASRKAYVKSTNNRTDSKGKKLDPYDDYQS